MLFIFYFGMFVLSASVILFISDVVFKRVDLAFFKKQIKSKYGLNIENLNESNILEQFIINVILAFGSFKLICDSQWGWVFVVISIVLMFLAKTKPLP